jgi:hypothetical protein
MTKTKITLAAALLAAAFATPALAIGSDSVVHYVPQAPSFEDRGALFGMETRSHGVREPRLIQSRNTAVFGNDFGDTGSTSRDAMVQELGN